MHAVNSNAVTARNARWPIDRRPPESSTSSTAVGRNVVSTGGTAAPGEKMDPAGISGSAAGRAASWAGGASSKGATLTASGATTRMCSDHRLAFVSAWIALALRPRSNVTCLRATDEFT
jgi:hypothetical protein